MNNRIALLRKAYGLSQQQLAQTLHISPSAVGMYEQGRRTPGIEMLIDMANLFEVSLDYLITGKEATNKTTTLGEEVTQLTCPCRACRFCCNKYESTCVNERHANAMASFREMLADLCQSVHGSAGTGNDTTGKEKGSVRRP